MTLDLAPSELFLSGKDKIISGEKKMATPSMTMHLIFMPKETALMGYWSAT